MEIPRILKDEIWDYCRLNNITNIDEFTIKLLRQGFTIEKFGATPVMREKPNEEEVLEIKPIELELSEDIKKRIEDIKDVSDILEKEVEKQMVKKPIIKKNKDDLYGE